MSEHTNVETLINDLKSENSETRKSALLALSEIMPRADRTLIFAIGYYAEQTKNELAVQLLKDAIANPDTHVRHAAVNMLDWIYKEQTVAYLIQVLLTHPSGDARETAAEGLGSRGAASAAKPLAQALFDPQSQVRMSAYAALMQIKTRGHSMSALVDYLTSKLIDTDPQIRQLAVQWLGTSQDVRALEPLVASLEQDEVSSVRAHAAMSLARLKDQRAADPLIKALSDNVSSEIGKVCDYAAAALGELGDLRAVEPLILALNNGCEGAAEGLRLLGDLRAIDPLITAFRQGNFTAGFALGMLNDSRGIDVLLDELQSEYQEEYMAAYTALERVRVPRAVEALEAFRKTERFAEMQRLASDVMGQIAKIATDVGKDLNK